MKTNVRRQNFCYSPKQNGKCKDWANVKCDFDVEPKCVIWDEVKHWINVENETVVYLSAAQHQSQEVVDTKDIKLKSTGYCC